jgi:hypothetical protein
MKGQQHFEETQPHEIFTFVNGKHKFHDIFLSFYLLGYNPKRNIEFTLSLLRTDKGKPEVEVGTYKIKSGDYIT